MIEHPEPSDRPPHPAPDFDESLLEINLQRTVEERILAHDAALEVAREFQKAGREYRREAVEKSRAQHGNR